MKRIALSLVVILNWNISICCTCFMTESFNFFAYTEARNIIEVDIISESKIEDYQTKLNKYRKLINDWKEDTPPPLPPPPPDEFITQNVRVRTLFKGNNVQVNSIRIYDIESSCFWKPTVGEKYILYLGEILTLSKNKQVYVLSGCQRRINSKSNNFNSEKRVLKKIKDKKSNRFIIDQSELIPEMDRRFIVLKGRFKNGKIHGKWIIGEPIIGEEKSESKALKFFRLYFRNGKLKKIRSLDKSKIKGNSQMKEYYLRSWYINLILNY